LRERCDGEGGCQGEEDRGRVHGWVVGDGWIGGLIGFGFEALLDSVRVVVVDGWMGELERSWFAFCIAHCIDAVDGGVVWMLGYLF